MNAKKKKNVKVKAKKDQNKKVSKKKINTKLNKKIEKKPINKESIANDKTAHNKTTNNLKIVVAIMVVTLLLIYAIYVVVNLIKNPTSTFMVANGEVSQEETVSGYIIREETVIRGENYKNGMVKIKDEGSKVAKGESIFRYYSSGEEQLKQKIAELDVKIQQIMSNEDGAFGADIKLLESQIEDEIDEVYNVNSIQKIEEYKKNISSNITKKAKISGSLSPEGSYLRKLMEERARYEEQLNSNSEYIQSSTSGIVSYRVDGLEEVLTTANFGTFNKEFLEKLNLKTGQTIASSEEKGKIINNYYCYLIFNTNSNEAMTCKIDDKISIRLQNSNTVKATVTNIIEEFDGSRTITIKIEKNVEDIISYRKITFDIVWWNASGYRIPNEAIKEIDGLSYVVRNRNGYYNKMVVKILKQNDEYCIVKQYTTEELKELGFTSTQIYSMKNINLYDEIVLNPEEEQLLQ